MSRLSWVLLLLVLFFAFCARSANASSYLCQDNFSNLQTCVWTTIPATQDVFVREKPFYSSRVASTTPTGRYFLLTGNKYESDYILRYHIKGIFGTHKKTVFRFQDVNNYYLLDLKSSINGDDSWIYLYKVSQGQEELLQSVKFSNQINNWYFMELRVVGNQISASIFDRPLIYYTDQNPLLFGSMGFAADGETNEDTQVWYNFIDIIDLSQNNPVIFIPGLGASWNVPALLSCDLKPTNGWTLAPYADLYERLIRTFTQNGYSLNKDFYVYNYDWRQSMDQAGKNFKDYLDGLLQTNPAQQFNIVSHSLGGLVIRSYLQQNPAGSHVKKVITLGSPHQGTVLAYPMWEAGEIWSTNQMQKMATSYLVNHCRSPLKLSSKDVLHAIAPSIKDLLPTFDYLKLNGQNSLTNIKTLQEQNTWLTNNPLPSDLFNTQFITISGAGAETLDYLEVEPTSTAEKLLGLWPDGKPVNNHSTAEGDGTILQNSALISSAVTEIINNTDHGGLVYSDNGIKTIFKYLNQPNVVVATYKPTPQISDTTINIPGQAQTVWKKYTLKIHN